MKLRLLFFAAVCCTISCNEDDAGNPVDPQEKQLASVSVFNNDGNNIMDDQILFEDNKPADRYIYNTDGQVAAHLKFTYNDSGLLILNERFDGNDNLIFTNIITYDGSGRISQMISQSLAPPGLPVQKDYVYNSDNTITCTLSSLTMEPDSQFYIYHLNNEGQVYKIVEDYEFEEELNYDYEDEVTYSGNNISSWTRKGYFDDINEQQLINSYIMTYDTNLPVHGDYLKFYMNMFGSYIPNAFLYGQFITGFEISDNYLTNREDAEGNIMTRAYEFDEEDYPINQKTYMNNVLETDTYIEYQD